MPTTYIPPRSKAVTINYEAIVPLIDGWARKTMEQALDELQERAKSRAPVRNVFQGGRRPKERVPRGIFRRNGQVFGRAIRHWTEAGRDRFMARVNAQTKPTRRFHAEETTKSGQIVGRYIEGNSRSETPILRSNGIRVSGDFRRVSIHATTGRVMMGNAPAISETGQTFVQRGADTENRLLNRHGRYALQQMNTMIEKAKKNRKLSVRDIRRAIERDSSIENRMAAGLKRPRFGVFMTSGGQLQLGGRLKHEIHRGDVQVSGGLYFGEVISPTEYAKYQEYGTSRHRAQPYMRPALYEMRSRLPALLRSNIRKDRGL
jgi:HK97 gp10 family phage protein